jgi:hypothetical protein
MAQFLLSGKFLPLLGSYHLHLQVTEYDELIRRFIPRYDEMLDEVVRLIRDASGSLGRFVDLGIGTGSLAERVLKAIPEAQVIVGKKQSSPSPQESHERRIDELIAG